jgi:hypothetical protein
MGGIAIIASKAYSSPMASWSPRCFPDASQMLPRCIPYVSQLPPRCLPDASRMLPRCFPDASSASSSFKWLPNASQKTLFGVSCWSHTVYLAGSHSRLNLNKFFYGYGFIIVSILAHPGPLARGYSECELQALWSKILWLKVPSICCTALAVVQLLLPLKDGHAGLFFLEGWGGGGGGVGINCI